MIYSTFSREQILAGLKTLDYYNLNMRYVLLTAQMQSGKTSTYYFVAAEMIRNGKINTGNVVIFCGNAEIKLRDQVEYHSFNKFVDYYKVYLNSYLGYSDTDIELLIFKIKEKIIVIWGSELKKVKATKRGYVLEGKKRAEEKFFPFNNNLFIWEESHFAQNKGMNCDTFLHTVNLSADGNTYCMEEHDNYLLSISATPFSEISDNIHQNQFKGIVKLGVSDAYFGVEKMHKNKNLVPYTDWKNCFENALIEELRNLPTFALFRGVEKETEQAVLIAERLGWVCKFLDSSKSDDKHEKFDINEITPAKYVEQTRTPPTRHTVIFLKQMCRMGQEIDKTNISFCMETTKTPNTDVILQGLMGRLCGYHNFTSMRIFLHQNIMESGELERYIHYTHNEEIENTIIPNNSRNMLSNSNQKKYNVLSSELSAIIPIKIPCESLRIDGSEEVEPANEYKQYCKDAVKAAFNRGDIENYNCDEQLSEISEQLENFVDKNVHVKIVDEQKTYLQLPKKINEIITTHMPGKLGSTLGIAKEGGEINIWWFKKSFPEYNISRGDIFIDARTVSKPILSEEKMKEQHILQNVPKTNGRSVFAKK
jgi:hypothetical protein